MFDQKTIAEMNKGREKKILILWQTFENDIK